MIIRKAKIEDIATIAGFNQAMARETEGRELSFEKLQNGVAAVFGDPSKGFYLVAESENGIVACLLVTSEWSDWRNGWFWWIQSVYVRPEDRGRGVYSSMYRFVKSLAEKESDVCGFRLYVEMENVTAQKVYERLGMQKTHYFMYEEELAK